MGRAACWNEAGPIMRISLGIVPNNLSNYLVA